jgi:iron complex transport system substrate-binding protein
MPAGQRSPHPIAPASPRAAREPAVRPTLPTLPTRPASGRWRVRAATWLLTAIAALGAGMGWAQPVRVTDDRGVTVVLAQPPQRIVSLLPSITETVCVLDACARLVGVDRFSNWPESVRGLPRLGGLDDIPIEALVRLKPDVVLATRWHRTLERLEALGVPVVALETNHHADARRTLDLVAQLLGEPSRADAAWAQVQQQIQAAAESVPPALRGARVYFEIGATPHAAGRASFIGQTLAALGLENIVPAEMGPFPQLNPEYVVRADPEVVFTTTREAARMPSRPGWQGLQALRAGRVCRFGGAQWDLLVRPGPRLGEAAQAMADCLNALPATPLR